MRLSSETARIGSPAFMPPGSHVTKYGQSEGTVLLSTNTSRLRTRIALLATVLSLGVRLPKFIDGLKDECFLSSSALQPNSWLEDNGMRALELLWRAASALPADCPAFPLTGHLPA